MCRSLHIINFALSDSEASLKRDCEHDHDNVCDECENMDRMLTLIRQKAEEKKWEKREFVMYKVKAILLISNIPAREQG